MRFGLLLIAFAIPAQAAHCFAIGNITSKADFLNPVNWASTAGGTPGTCAAAGGSGAPIYGQTATIPANVPGAVGQTDTITVSTGLTVYLATGLGIDVGSSAANVGFAIEINGTSPTVFGAFIVQPGALAIVRGFSTNNGMRKVDRYAVLQVMPGGWMVNYGASGTTPTDIQGGRIYLGCEDQTLYPTPFCTSGSAGVWVTPSVASGLNFTATSLPGYFAVNDLVELDRTPQAGLPYPYTGITGITPPPAFPTMPQTSDTGSSPMRTCGTFAACLIPESTPLCIVAISGSSVSLGWPQGGTTAAPYCVGGGAETPIAITALGSGQLWLKKPDFFWGPYTLFTWNNSKTQSYTGTTGFFDAVRSSISLKQINPISNAAGNGPGRVGDNSLSLTSTNFGAPCTALRIEDITQANQVCYVDYDRGALYVYGRRATPTGSGAWTSVSAPSGASMANMKMGITTAQTYAELIIGNTDVRYLYASTSDNGVIFLQGSPNTANQHVAFKHCTVKMAGLMLGIGSNTLPLNPTTANPIEVTDNSIFAGPPYSAIMGPFSITGASQNVDVSRNYVDDWHMFVASKLTSSSVTTTVTHMTVTANEAWTDSLFGMDAGDGGTTGTQFPAALVQQNRVMGGLGGNGPSNAPTPMIFAAPESNDPNNPVQIDWNYLYGAYRGGQLAVNVWAHHNVVAFAWHHMFVMGEGLNNLAGNLWYRGTLAQNVLSEHNVLLMDDSNSQAVASTDTGYDEPGFVDSVVFRNNTSLGMSLAGVAIGDPIDSATTTLIAGLQVYDNILGTVSRGVSNIGAGLAKSQQNTAGAGPIFEQDARVFVGWNSMQGTTVTTQGAPTPSVNNIPNPDYLRNTLVTWHSGVDYNLDPTRALTGVSLQNPAYSTNQTGTAVTLVSNSSTDKTLAFALNGVSFGTAAQVNWAGAGTTYTVASVTDPGAVWHYSRVTMTTTPFTGIGTPSISRPTPTTCPVSRWLVVISSSTVPVGAAYAITACGATTADIGVATGALNIVPREVRFAAGDVVAVFNSQVRLFDAGGTNYVDAAIDARSLPSGGGTDSGISLSLTDYCSTSTICTSGTVVSGLPTSSTAGVSNGPLIPLTLPWLGGSAEQAFTGGFYVPSGTAWEKASSTGSYIGAIPPPNNGNWLWKWYRILQ